MFAGMQAAWTHPCDRVERVDLKRRSHHISISCCSLPLIKQRQRKSRVQPRVDCISHGRAITGSSGDCSVRTARTAGAEFQSCQKVNVGDLKNTLFDLMIRLLLLLLLLPTVYAYPAQTNMRFGCKTASSSAVNAVAAV